MENWLLTPPLAFLVYIFLVGILSQIGRAMAGPPEPSVSKSSLYSGGEEAPPVGGAPGYRPFFLIALFFAILHLGVLMLGTSGFSVTSGIYLVGLFVALTALILG